MGYFWEGQDKWNLKKQNRIIRTYEEPVLPLLCRIIFWSMLVLTASMIAVDISFFIRYDRQAGLSHLLFNVSATGFFAWFFFSVFLIPFSLAAVKQVQKRFKKTVGKSGSTGGGKAKAQSHMEAVYTRYVKISAAGLVIWGLLFLVVRVLY